MHQVRVQVPARYFQPLILTRSIVVHDHGDISSPILFSLRAHLLPSSLIVLSSCLLVFNCFHLIYYFSLPIAATFQRIVQVRCLSSLARRHLSFALPRNPFTSHVLELALQAHCACCWSHGSTPSYFLVGPCLGDPDLSRRWMPRRTHHPLAPGESGCWCTALARLVAEPRPARPCRRPRWCQSRQ
ncbi:uncharacterized protein BO88DRAFT_180525 [Aspergillus vadensis CBS 113365]|uniref:Uncharacterized protein n=1 Tax=Aspergillus vadensis (strain CBS 113365 / IMI 142717 / IBT 24658) TaxID=1448311 RepID=A0A319BLY1_ASPVC|nr:hypothetical protein BO88DRAFT_180525 [Aspergillus vadensis CBS 113365]PYH64268.1 hypothetical protein BO88DRAFT_180525 [Aspergillus vadensis CBS 113365]